MAEETTQLDEKQVHEQSMKMQSLREMITSAEKTIQGAKAMLLQLEGKKKVGRHRKLDEEEEGGTVIQGTFDGQIMLGSDGKHYPVPANYASKSKLVEGDLLKLHITADGSFIYKQIGPVERKHALGIVTQDEAGNFIVIADGKPYRLLLASVTYFKAAPGDEAAIVTARDIDSQWASLENIVQKAKYGADELPLPAIVPIVKKSPSATEKPAQEELLDDEEEDDDDFLKEWRKNIDEAEKEIATPKKTPATKTVSAPAKKKEASAKKEASKTEEAPDDLLEEWRADIEAIEKEIAESEK